ncbi:DHCW motif cupin fold protein [Sphingomonas sp. PB2P19]|uniref:DHCW motif cupin fold protein n=1 Tax=Sphingomonas rhamnosi TaxID=3096156 RepID=UPI002FCC0406
MKLATLAFTVTDWSAVPTTRHEGETGYAEWRTLEFGETRVRMVDYSPGYRADHWCERGHILLVVRGELDTELRDGRRVRLTPGMSYQVSDCGDAAHRSSSGPGATVFIVD